MPIRKRSGENREEFLERCIPIEISTGKTQEQSVAICINIWEEKQLSAVKRIRSSKKKDLMEFRKERTFVDSTNADRIMYDTDTLELTIQFQDGSKYTYFDVNEELYLNVLDGNASTRTAGEWGPVGKSPSVGAAIHQYLIERNIRYEKGGSFR
jgi:hypothetical protein